MREIKFRGIALSDNKFCYGYLTKKEEAKAYYIGFHGYYDEAYKYQLVYPDSVGQYTGLTDKNGIEIYEGDIVKLAYEDLDDNILYATCSVSYSVKDCMFLAIENKLIFTFENPTLGGATYEVIGNIHQNPELLK